MAPTGPPCSTTPGSSRPRASSPSSGFDALRARRRSRAPDRAHPAGHVLRGRRARGEGRPPSRGPAPRELGGDARPPIGTRRPRAAGDRHLRIVAGPTGGGRLRPATGHDLRARLALVKRVPAGQGIGYGHVYRPEVDTSIGLAPLGYADGIPRNATNVRPVRVGDHRTTVAGRVCMDQFVIDLGPQSPAVAGDVVTLFGADPAEPTAQDWRTPRTPSATRSCRGSARVPRLWRGGGSQGGAEA